MYIFIDIKKIFLSSEKYLIDPTTVNTSILPKLYLSKQMISEDMLGLFFALILVVVAVVGLVILMKWNKNGHGHTHGQNEEDKESAEAMEMLKG